MHASWRILSCLAAASLGCAELACAEDNVIERSELLLRRSFSGATPEQWTTRLRQDSTQALCSKYRNQPPPQVAAQIAADARSSMRFPESRPLLGDWRQGERLASIGAGGQIGTIEPDRPDTPRGGNCYACHALAPTEVAAGTLGPSLTGYGRRHGTSSESVRSVYQRIYNAQAFTPCSVMPRFGHNGWLTPEQIADIVAYLLDPASPVNK